MPEPSQSPQNKSARRQLVNIIYFVDANKTRSFKIPLTTVRIGFAVLASVVLWTVCSPFLIGFMLGDINERDARIRTYMGTIFSYQTRYDDVYEKAYPYGQPKALAKRSPQAVVNPKAEEKSAAAKKPAKTSTQKVAAKPAKAEKKKEQPAKSTAIATSSGSETLNSDVKIDEPTYQFDRNKLKLRFAIKNVISPKRAEGTVFGVAAFRTTSGDIRYVPSPKGINVSASGEPRSPRSGYKYSIRYYKVKTMVFKKPTGVEGRFKEVVVSLQDKGGKIARFTIPVEETISKGASVDERSDNHASPNPVSGSAQPTVPGFSSGAL